MEENKFSIEDSFEELENIIEKLEEEDTSLNDAVKLYSDGVKLLRMCKVNLEDVEKEIIVLSDKGDLEND